MMDTEKTRQRGAIMLADDKELLLTLDLLLQFLLCRHKCHIFRRKQPVIII